jgi:mRNA-degrading endonuclease RelE of RelBE toxin-antitoxin system
MWHSRARAKNARKSETLRPKPFRIPLIVLQIVFNEISAAEMSALPKEMQLDLLAEFQFLPEDLDKLDDEKFGMVERDGKRLYRYRAKEYRIYFEHTPEGITVHRVLHKNTIRDFLFRTKLPMTEDDQLGQREAFWKLIEEGEQTRKR